MMGERPFGWGDSLDPWSEMSVWVPFRRGGRNEAGQRVEGGLLSLWESHYVPFELDIFPMRNQGRFLTRTRWQNGMTTYGKRYLSAEWKIYQT